MHWLLTRVVCTCFNQDGMLYTKVKFSCHVNPSVSYVDSCLELVILIKMSTNNPSQKSMVFEHSAQTKLLPSQTGSPCLVWRSIDSGCKPGWSDRGYCCHCVIYPEYNNCYLGCLDSRKQDTQGWSNAIEYTHRSLLSRNLWKYPSIP